MKGLSKKIWLSLGLTLFLTAKIVSVSAQSLTSASPINFISFSGIYYLNRDAHNVSFLSSEEAILADFGRESNQYGITRSIPKRYQNQSVDVKVISATDEGGKPIPYHTNTDKNDNLVVTIGNPVVTLYGLQTFKLTYRTSSVINLKPGEDEFLLNTNGRGWNQSFSRVGATIHLPRSFSNNLISQPSCYIGYLSSTFDNCTISSQNSASDTVIMVNTKGPLSAHQALVVKMNFKKGSFSLKNHDSAKLLIALAVLVAAAVSAWAWLRRRF